VTRSTPASIRLPGLRGAKKNGNRSVIVLPAGSAIAGDWDLDGAARRGAGDTRTIALTG